jgi:hypothetical protein
MFHLSSKMFRLEEFANPFVDFRDTEIVLSAVVHTGNMVSILRIEYLIDLPRVKLPLAYSPINFPGLTFVVRRPVWQLGY